MIPVSIVIVTKNEEANIEAALDSVKDAAEIVVIDSFSSDRTVEICRKYTDKVFQKEWEGYARQKQSAVDLAEGPWVFILDADERFTPELKAEVINAVEEDSYDGFYAPRKNFFMDRWIRHGGWRPDYTLRLFRKNAGKVEDREVHEKVIVNGSVSYLKNPLVHYTYNSVSDYLKRMDVYSTLAAKELKKTGVAPNVLDFLLRPPAAFIKMFFFRFGFLDGRYGLVLAVLYSYYTFLKYAKTWEMK
ncbi:MAG: glycosyltransferase family 2 protein [Nitrospirae bacterium]|nr:glycosyltransferase family 2 protein [Nitrospirota bacterium]MBI3378161.1 glycosyltransferase family 2 protein [Nitrospirota bacterium]